MTEAAARPDATWFDPAWLRPGWLEDWITIWHSELAAAITDREAQETQLRLLDLWAAEARRAARAIDRSAGSASSPGSAPVADAPAARPAEQRGGGGSDPRDAVIAGLLERVAELERRLAAGETGGGTGGPAGAETGA